MELVICNIEAVCCTIAQHFQRHTHGSFIAVAAHITIDSCADSIDDPVLRGANLEGGIIICITHTHT